MVKVRPEDVQPAKAALETPSAVQRIVTGGRVCEAGSGQILVPGPGPPGCRQGLDPRSKSPIKRTWKRRNDLDGRGNLSEEELASFTTFFLETCLHQVQFMEELMQPAQLHTRILQWAETEIRLGHLQPKSGAILSAILYRGELPRGEIQEIVGTGDRQARRVVAPLIERGVLHSQSPRAPLLLSFPAALASRWMPGLFPEKTG